MSSIVFAGLIGCLSVVPDNGSPSVIAVCPEPYQRALQPWVDRRQAEGLEVQIIGSMPTAQKLSHAIRKRADPTRTRYVLLVGDCSVAHAHDGSDPKSEVPTFYIPAKVTAAWGTTPLLPGDYSYGDFDADGKPEAAVGRLPVHSATELTELLQRIAMYEASKDFGPWRETIQLTAGVGGFGRVADKVIESLTRRMLTGSMPATTQTCVTFASQGSPFNPGFKNFHQTVLQRYSEGSRFWIYAGHGWITELDRVPRSDSGRPVLTTQDVKKLRCDVTRAPIALIFACYTGAFDAPSASLAERMLLANKGPIAVLCGSRVTMPYGNASVASGLIQAVYKKRVPRLGDAWLSTLREMATESKDDPQLASRRLSIDTLATLIGPGDVKPLAERREHMHLYNWLGDPTMPIRHATPIALDSSNLVVAGSPIQVSGQAPRAGTLTISLRRSPGTLPPDTPLDRRYQVVNHLDEVTKTIPLARSGAFTAKLLVPETSRGAMRIVAFLESADGYASGAKRVLVRPRKKR